MTDKHDRRFDQAFGIGYGNDTALAILNRVAAEEARALQDPAPLIEVEALGDSSVDNLTRPGRPR